MTVTLASNLDQVSRISPPRALYCEFPLGRPLGRPRDAGFQHAVLEHAFRLLDQRSGPVLETYPEVILDEPDVPLACPIPPANDATQPPAVAEAVALLPIWERFRSTHPVSNVGRVIGPAEVADAVGRLVRMVAGEGWEQVGFASEQELFSAVADVRAFYEESALVLADEVPAARKTEAWFFQRTETGALLMQLADLIRQSPERFRWHMPAGYIVPLSQNDQGTGTDGAQDRSEAGGGEEDAR